MQQSWHIYECSLHFSNSKVIIHLSLTNVFSWSAAQRQAKGSNALWTGHQSNLALKCFSKLKKRSNECTNLLRCIYIWFAWDIECRQSDSCDLTDNIWQNHLCLILKTVFYSATVFDFSLCPASLPSDLNIFQINSFIPC